MSPKSAPLTAGDYILYTQYNDLRDDVLDPTDGHTHSGNEGDGKIIYARAYISDTPPASPFPGMIWVDTSE